MNDSPPKPYNAGDVHEPEVPWCPFFAMPAPGPLGKVSIFRSPCDPIQCALGVTESGKCSVRQAELRLANIEKLLHVLLQSKTQSGGTDPLV